jgi:GNAT superfamily N-acetyltransferase
MKFTKDRKDIVELLALGFGHKVEEVDPKQILEDEYDHGEDRTVIFLAEKEGRIVGSLYFILWRNTEEDKRGKPMMEYLKKHGEGLIDLNKIQDVQVLAGDIGVVVHPKNQGQGVADEMYTEALKTVRPIFLVGQTKTPAAVVSRERSLRKKGYETYYGGLPIHEGNERLGKFTADMYLEIRKDRAIRVGDKGIHYDPADDVLKPGIDVDLTRLPKNVSTVFEQIIEADKTKPKGQISFGVLVSVDKDYIL